MSAQVQEALTPVPTQQEEQKFDANLDYLGGLKAAWTVMSIKKKKKLFMAG